jgi:hypothetical protein
VRKSQVWSEFLIGLHAFEYLIGTSVDGMFHAEAKLPAELPVELDRVL